MKIAICSTGNQVADTVSNRFGRAEYFAVYNTTDSQWVFLDNSQDLQAAQGAGIQSAQTIIDSGADVLLALNVGPKAMKALTASGIKVYLAIAGKSLEQVLAGYNSGELVEIEQANVEGHWV